VLKSEDEKREQKEKLLFYPLLVIREVAKMDHNVH